MARADRFLKACRREPVDATPVWLMRQAGRYMPEYRALRERHGFLDLVKNPELAAAITLQPVDAFEVDAAIVFADILTLLESLGLRIEFTKGDGPAMLNPVRSPADVDALAARPPEESLGFTLEAIRQARRALGGRVPLIGFSGAPFTLACYAIQGGGSRDFALAARFRAEHPAAFHRLLEKLAVAVGAYLRAQVEAGAQALQLFDSWVGLLDAAAYREFVLPHSAAAIRAARADGGVPLIHFGTRTGPLLPLLREAGGDVIGVDAQTDLADAWARLGAGVAVQGNLDPELLKGPVEPMQREAARILDSVRGRAGHIFNLGHGVLKETPPEHVAALVDFVHGYSAGTTAETRRGFRVQGSGFSQAKPTGGT